ncbi:MULTISPECIES: flagellar hook-associated protein 2 [Sediminibacillus]|uniref:flagellar hook-associated protein 2 n=1 Tax=Sediminibacillus TaxID=482460 RepID=UPI00041171BF|nr:flagellar hook-associated protein 2 [Sediminibacillus terrae]
MVNNVNSMRIGGLASGMDIDQLVNDLMEAERIPLQKMEQDKTWTTWQRDAYRDVNKSLSELDDLVQKMKYQKVYSTRQASSSQENAVSATAAASASNGTYNIEVTQLAEAAVNVSTQGISGGTEKINPFGKLSEQNFTGGVTVPSTMKFTTYENGEGTEYEIDITENDTLNSVLTKITNQDNGVRAFYDVQADKVVMERTEAGVHNEGGPEIDFSADTSGFFTGTLQLGQEKAAQDAEFIYNGAITLKSKTNSTTLNGVTFNFNDITNGSANITVSNDVDASVEKIMEFVDKYNEVIEKVNGSLSEERYRDYKPLTDAQKEEMSDKEIELWEEKAKSGLLKGDSILSSGIFSMRQDWYSEINNESEFSHLSEIGIETSPNYLDGGKLIVTEKKLREALQKDPDSVYKLFSNDVEGEGRGIVNRLDDSINSTVNRIEERAGKGYQTLEQYTMGKRLKDMDSRIDQFQDRLTQIEDRYWSQFTAMEKAIQRMNEQSSYLMQQFNG